MNCKNFYLTLLLIVSLGLAGCGGGDVSEFSDDDLPSPVAGGIDDEGNLDPSAPGSNPVSEEELANLPQVNAGTRIFADPNVLVTLNGTATARAGATIAQTLWTQVSGPEVIIPNPRALSTSIIMPDILEETQLVFRLTALDSENRINSAAVAVVVKPSPAFARVVGEVAEVGELSVVFNIRLNAAQPDDVSINYQTQDGTAIAGIDYEATAGTLVIPAGQTEAQVTVRVLPGSFDGVDETFVMRITVISDTQNSSSNAGVVLLRDTPDPMLLAPLLVAAEPLVLVLGELITPLVLGNEGGVGLTSCELAGESSLPQGLNVAVTEDATSCVINGTPALVQAATTASIVATNEAGSSTVDVVFSVVTDLLAPVLVAPEPLTFLINSLITPITLENQGGGELISCEVSGDTSLPAGLVLAIADEGASCAISGTPQTIQAAATTEITATNAAGRSAVLVSIELVADLQAPNLADLAAPIFRIGVPLESLAFENSGGGELTCEFDDRGGEERPAPSWLTVSPSEDGSTCVLSGTPTEIGLDFATVIATNASGTDTANVDIDVRDILLPPDLVDPPVSEVIEGIPITPIIIENIGGGELTECTGAGAGPPNGLNINIAENGSSCVITGTLVFPNQGADFAFVQAINDAGEDDTSVDFNLIFQPRFEVVEPQTYFLGEPMTPLFISNPVTDLTSCDAVTPLPDGLALELDRAGRSCVLSGTPTLESAATDYIISATSAAGTGQVTVSIAVSDLVETITFGLADGDEVCGLGLATSAGIATVDWNDGSDNEVINNRDVELVDAAEAGALEHTFEGEGAPRDFSVTFSRGVASLTALADNGCAYDFDVAELLGAEDLQVLKLTGLNGNLNGDLATLAVNHPQMRDLALIRVPIESFPPTFAGALGDMPPNLESFATSGGIELVPEGSLNDLPASLQSLDLDGVGGLVGGSIENLPDSLTSLRITDPNAIVGDLGGLRPDMRVLEILGDNAITGDIDAMTNDGGSLMLGLNGFRSLAPTRIFGSTDGIPGFITHLTLVDGATISGDIAQLHSGLERLVISNSDSANLRGDLSLLPATGSELEIDISSNNAITGDIGNIPERLTRLRIQSPDTINDGNTLSGNIESIHSAFVRFWVVGQNSISGDIGQIAANGIEELVVGGENLLGDFGPSPTWAPVNLQNLILVGGAIIGDGGSIGYSSDEVDAILIHLNTQIPAVADPDQPAVISMQRSGDNPATTVSSDARIELQNKGFTVQANGGPRVVAESASATGL